MQLHFYHCSLYKISQIKYLFALFGNCKKYFEITEKIIFPLYLFIWDKKGNTYSQLSPRERI